MRDALDPKAWNLFVGAALLTGCGARALPGGDETSSSAEVESDTTDSTSTDSTDSTSTTSTSSNDGDPECYVDQDCYFDGYNCIDGECVPGECYSEGNCDEFEVCDMDTYECVALGEPPPSCGLPEFDIPTTLDLGFSWPLALTFADIDDDGRDELVIATESELLVYESGSDVPTITMRDFESSEWTSMVAGQFDGQPGEDLTLHVAGVYNRYFSDGVGGFASQSTAPSPLPSAYDMRAGDLDGQAPTDLLLWGWADGATLHTNMDIIPLSAGHVDGVAAFDFGSPHAGIAYLVNEVLIWADFDGAIGPTTDGGDQLTTVTSPGEARFVDTYTHFNNQAGHIWYDVHLHDPLTLQWNGGFVLSNAAHLQPGDFDGDQIQELFAIGNDEYSPGPATVVFDPFDIPCIATQDLGTEPGASVGRIAVGDHDGDGDDEVALLFGFESTEEDFILLLDLE